MPLACCNPGYRAGNQGPMILMGVPALNVVPPTLVVALSLALSLCLQGLLIETAAAVEITVDTNNPA